jgi:hypothetical protein
MTGARATPGCNLMSGLGLIYVGLLVGRHFRSTPAIERLRRRPLGRICAPDLNASSVRQPKDVA